MTAPALVALANGGRDARSVASVTSLVDMVRTMRPDLRIERAFVEAGRPGFRSVIDRLARRGVEEAVVVPLQLGDRLPADSALAGAVAAMRDRADIEVRATAGLGLEPAFLEVLDERLREALRQARVRELDALVLAADGSADSLGTQAVARLARVWGTHHRLPVTAAFAAVSPPSTGEAVRAFRSQGRRHIAVGTLILEPGSVADRAAELALEAGAIAVSEPLGAHHSLARAVLARYAVGAVELVPV